MAAILTELGEPTLAVTRARQALAAHLKVSARNEEAYDRMQLAYSLALSEDTAEAGRQADAALRISTEIRNPAAAREAAGIAAHLALANKNPSKALAYLDMVGKEPVPVDWRLADLRALALLRLGRVREARVEGNKSLRALERERASLGDGPLRAGYLASRTAPFSHMIEIDLASSDTAAAFAVAASLPGRSLSERLAGVTNAPGQLAIAVRREDLLLRIAALERELEEARNHDDPAEKQAALERSLQSARGAFEDQIDREAATPGNPATVDVQLSSVQHSLGSKQTLLLLVPGPENLDLFAVTSRRVFHSTARVGTQLLLRRVQVVREFLQMGGDFTRISKPLGELFDLLVRPAIDARMLAPGGEVSIATAGALGALPFAALWDKSIGHLLVEDYAISYLPSLVELLQAPQQSYATLRNPSVFAPLPDSLPGTRAEARAIANVYPAASLLVGRAATEQRFRSALRADRVIHVASHGSYNLQNPLFSRIAVGTAASQSPEDDGRLEVHEILALTTRSPLVFLSGCETAGSGTAGFGSGADEVSLAHAFLIAGAGTVVATRWMIDDATAAQIGGSFYRELKSGNSPGQALAVAQRQALRNRKNFTWAAYSVFGAPPRNSAGSVRTTSAGL
jgi:CHAT domain-containing protein